MKLFLIIVLFLQVEWSVDYDSQRLINFKAESLLLESETDVLELFLTYKKVKDRYYMVISYSPYENENFRIKYLNEERQKKLYNLSLSIDTNLQQNIVFKYDKSCKFDKFNVEFKRID